MLLLAAALRYIFFFLFSSLGPLVRRRGRPIRALLKPTNPFERIFCTMQDRSPRRTEARFRGDYSERSCVGFVFWVWGRGVYFILRWRWLFLRNPFCQVRKTAPFAGALRCHFFRYSYTYFHPPSEIAMDEQCRNDGESNRRDIAI